MNYLYKNSFQHWLVCTLMVVLAVVAMSFKPDTPTIYIIGDSTAAEKDISKGSTERGWGMVLQGFFDEGIRVENHAKNGRSSRSFYSEAVMERCH